MSKLCPYCEESDSKEECDQCIDNFKQNQSKTEKFMAEIVGKTCHWCGVTITKEDAKYGKPCIVTGSDITSKRYEHAMGDERCKKMQELKE